MKAKLFSQALIFSNIRHTLSKGQRLADGIFLFHPSECSVPKLRSVKLKLLVRAAFLKQKGSWDAIPRG